MDWLIAFIALLIVFCLGVVALIEWRLELIQREIIVLHEAIMKLLRDDTGA
jgi:hypothetical protein